MRNLFVTACIISALIVVGAFTYSRWHLSQLEHRSRAVVENKGDQVNLNPPLVLDDLPSPSISNIHLDSINQDAFTALGINLEGLSEEEALTHVIEALEDTIRHANDVMAERQAFDRRGEAFNRKLQEATAMYAAEKAKAQTNAAMYAKADRKMRESLPDSFNYDFEMNHIIEQIQAGVAHDNIVASLAAKLSALQPVREPRAGGLPLDEFDPHDPRRAGN